MASITEKYAKIFNLEASKGYQDRAVFGGLKRLKDAWQSDAREAVWLRRLSPLSRIGLRRISRKALKTAGKHSRRLSVCWELLG